MLSTNVYVAYPAEVSQVPIAQDKESGYIYISCIVNGKSQVFMLDTGSTTSVIDTKFANETGITKGQLIEKVELGFAQGSAQAKKYEATIIIAGVPVVCKVTILDGLFILSLNDLLKAYDIQVTDAGPTLIAKGPNNLTAPTPISTTTVPAPTTTTDSKKKDTSSKKKKKGNMAFALA